MINSKACSPVGPTSEVISVNEYFSMRSTCSSALEGSSGIAKKIGISPTFFVIFQEAQIWFLKFFRQ